MKSLDRFMVFYFDLITFELILESFFEVLEESRNQRLRTKTATVQKWLRNCYVVGRHQLIIRASKETFLDVLSILQVSLS